MNHSAPSESDIKKEKALLIYFFNDDCAPCLSLRPKVEHLMVNFFPKMKFNLVNTKTDKELTAAFGIYSYPAILLFFDGKEYRRFSKYVSLTELKSVIDRYYHLLFEEE